MMQRARLYWRAGGEELCITMHQTGCIRAGGDKSATGCIRAGGDESATHEGREGKIYASPRTMHQPDSSGCISERDASARVRLMHQGCTRTQYCRGE